MTIEEKYKKYTDNVVAKIILISALYSLILEDKVASAIVDAIMLYILPIIAFSYVIIMYFVMKPKAPVKFIFSALILAAYLYLFARSCLS
ncbi:hypothetical protein [Enterococcus nangangensis]|uniref:hypothetical protein n=1 Tax=Enterococcus nangangensis TaxID=2559926 RepID=UPI0010F8C988|nr:hypothetical protein [Enterococcus nangangensis]